ncbi:MAG: aminotransferase class I/II-fold pyridoxal phosphate-dependent enzyme [Acidobacteriaceae bacterium]|nr:aminotransferase class I/II-fold pyridoxal phosphate-dependent enzyme [Acidobacteriaceae bacterium]
MKAIVLAAGVGGRMRPLTETVHKSLLPIGDTTIFGRILDGLLDIRIDEITVVTGHLSEQIHHFVSEHYLDAPIRFLHNQRYRDTNNIVSLAMALEQMWLDSDIILIECDVLFDPALLRRLTTAERGNIALVDRYRPGMDGTVVSVEGGIITQVFPPHLQTEDFDYRDKFKTVNIYRFDKDFCRAKLQPLLKCYADVIDSRCYYELVLGMLINMQRERVRAEVVDGSLWSEVDDPNDLAAARFLFEPDMRSKILEEAAGGHWNFPILDFSFMRNMYFPTDAMLAAMRRGMPVLAQSYGSRQQVLDRKLALVLRCEAERVICLNGATQIFPLLPRIFGRQRALLPRPTFGEFPRWFPDHECYTDAPGIEREQLEAAVDDHGVVVIVNPNNPTGTVLSTEWLHHMMARHPRTTFLVDESFVAFSNEKPLLTRLERAPLSNVLIIGSLSKCFGVPGLRLGYTYSANPDLLNALRAEIPIWNLGAMAEFFLELWLKFQPEYLDSLSKTAVDRCEFAKRLSALEQVQKVYTGGGNFLLLRLKGEDASPAKHLLETLLQENSIYVKDVSAKFPEPAPWIRVAVRRPAENLRLVDAMAAL